MPTFLSTSLNIWLLSTKIRWYVVCFFCFWGLCACHSGVDTEVFDPTEGLYYVQSFISPQDSLIKVYLYRVKALGEKIDLNSSVVPNAQVSISQGNASVRLSFNSRTLRYEVPHNQAFPILSSKTYSLHISTNTGKKLSATCLIPDAPPHIESFKGTHVANDYEFTLRWQAGLNNTRVFAKQDLIVEQKLQIGGSHTYLQYAAENSTFPLEVRPQSPLVSNGRIKDLTDANTCALAIELSALNGEMYKYLLSYQSYQIWSGNSFGLLPNFREPQPLYTNISGGIGIFGGFNQYQTLIPIK